MRVSERSNGRRLSIFPPWFVTTEIRRQVEAVMPNRYYRRLRIYFDKYGCIRCKGKLKMYAGSGLCSDCLGLIGDRLERIDKKLNKEHADPQEPSKVFLRRRETARRLLADFRGN
jgi:hypothetical protein